MQKHIATPLLLFVTMLLLGITASLPRIVAAVHDRATVDHIHYDEMESLKLDLSEKRQEMPIMEKLAMLGSMTTVDIDPSQTSMTEEEVFAAAEGAMEAYVQAGVFEWFDVTLRVATPKLGIDADDTNHFLVYWTVAYLNEYDSSRSLILDIDDETGKILCLRYDVYDSYTMEGVWVRNQAVMEKFTDIYFAQLGLSEAAQYAKSNEVGYAYYDRDGGVSDAQYSFGDALYGEVCLTFCVEGAGGFYLYFQSDF